MVKRFRANGKHVPRKRRRTFGTKKKRAIARIAQRVVNKNAEFKFHEVYNQTTASNSPAVAILTSIPQNDSDQGRDGDDIRLTSIKLKYKWDASGNDSFNYLRVVVFIWRPATTPVYTDLYRVVTVTEPVMYYYDQDKHPNFKILYDRTHYQNVENGTNFTAGRPGIVNTKLRMTNKIRFLNGGTSGHNHVYIMWMSDSSVVAHPNIQYSSKANYSDI